MADETPVPLSQLYGSAPAQAAPSGGGVPLSQLYGNQQQGGAPIQQGGDPIEEPSLKALASAIPGGETVYNSVGPVVAGKINHQPRRHNAH